MLELWFRQFADGAAARSAQRAVRGGDLVMCGIAGIVAADRLDADDAGARARAMRDVITHRGPDEAGLHVRRARGARPPPSEHRRSRAPGSSRCRTKTATSGSSSTARSTTTPTSGASSKRAAIATGRTPTPKRSSTPTRNGATTCVERFRGMFAFAIWDAPRRRLLLVARSPRRQAAVLDAAPATRCCSARRSRRFSRAAWCEPQANDGGAAGAARARATSSGTETMFRGIHKLLPGHLLVFEHGDVTIAAVLGRARSGTSCDGERAAARPTAATSSRSSARCSRSRSASG